MAAPLTGVQVAVPAQQNLQEQSPHKQGGSKFDEAMANRGGAGFQPQNEMNGLRVDPANKLDPSQLSKINQLGRGPVLANPETDMVSKLSTGLNSVDRHWNTVNDIMKTIFTKKDMSMQDCLKLQAIMQKYTMELDLTGKVVEKATNGLKDTLKTQV